MDEQASASIAFVASGTIFLAALGGITFAAHSAVPAGDGYIEDDLAARLVMDTFVRAIGNQWTLADQPDPGADGGDGADGSDGEEWPDGTSKDICHRRADGEPGTLSVSKSAWPGHQAHGDTIGACPGQSQAGGSTTGGESTDPTLLNRGEAYTPAPEDVVPGRFGLSRSFGVLDTKRLASLMQHEGGAWSATDGAVSYPEARALLGFAGTTGFRLLVLDASDGRLLVAFGGAVPSGMAMAGRSAPFCLDACAPGPPGVRVEILAWS